MKKKVSKVPDVVKCQNPKCDKRMVTKDYIGGPTPDKNTPRDQIHLTFEPNSPPFTLKCSTCEHFSTFTPHQQEYEKWYKA